MRWRRWILRGLLGLLALVALVVVVALLALAHLGSAPMKGIVVGQAKAAGVALDFDELGVTLGAIHGKDIAIHSPPADAALAPELVKIGSIEGTWSPFHKRLDDLVISNVTVTLVVDDDGTSSLDRFLAGLPPSAPKPKKPLSRLLEDLLPSGLAAHARLEGVTVVVVPRGTKIPPVRLEGVAAQAVLEGGKLDVTLGPENLALTVKGKSAAAHLAGSLAVAPPTVNVALDVTLARQDLAPELPPVKDLVSLRATATFSPGDKVRVVVDKLVVADGAALLTATADLFDTPGLGIRPVLVETVGGLDLPALARAAPAAFGAIEIEASEKLAFRAQSFTLDPLAGTLLANGKIDRFHWKDIDLRGAEVTLQAEPKGQTATLEANLVATRLETAQATVEDARIEVQIDRLALDTLTGAGTVTGTVGSVAVGTTRAHGTKLALTAGLDAPDRGHATLKLDVENLAANGLPPGAAHLEIDATRLELDRAALAKSRGEAKIVAQAAGVDLDGTVSGGAGDLAWDLHAKTAAIGPAKNVTVASKGALAKETIQADTTVATGAVKLQAASLTMTSANLHVVSSGTRSHQDAKIDAALDGVIVRGTPVGASRLSIDAKADLDKPHVDMTVTGQKPEVLAHLVADLPDGKTLHWQLDAKVSGLGAYSAFLPAGPDWTRLGATVKGQGTVTGAVSMKDGIPTLAPNPVTTARGKQSLVVGVHGVHVELPAARSADVEALVLNADVDLGKSAKMTLSVPTLSAEASGLHLGAEKLLVDVDSDLRSQATVHLRAESLSQSAFPSYPLRDIDLTAQVSGDPKAVLSMKGSLKNGGAGTQLTVEGALDRRTTSGGDAIPGRQSFWLSGNLEQSLDALTGAPDLLVAKGKVTVPFRVESGDLALFVARAQVQLTDVAIELPGQKMRVSGMNGRLPIVEEILLGPDGAKPVGRGERGLYGQLRFADHQPFLGTTDYLAVDKVEVAGKTFGPLAANARVDRDVVALDQLELEAAGGKIAGQFLVQIAGLDTSVAFRGKVTGLKPTSGDDRLDANAALTLIPYRMGLEGRVEIVQIGKQHLRDLLDLYDPYHADVGANRVRLALLVGYPQTVRLGFLRGFASLGVTLGGLAGAVRIDEIQGVPIGPALAKYLAPVLEKTK